MPWGLKANQIGKKATADTPATWPEFDVFGARYEKGAVTIVNLRAEAGKDSAHFAVVPSPRTWVNPGVDALHPDELPAANQDESHASDGD